MAIVLRFTLFAFLLTCQLRAYCQCPAPSANSYSGCAGAPSSPGAMSYTSSVTNHIWYTSQTGSATITPTTNFSPTTGIYVSTLQKTFYSSETYWVAAVCNGVQSSRVAVSFTISPNSFVTISASSTPTNVCPGSGFTLTASGGSNYKWYIGDPDAGAATYISSSTTIQPTQSGQYYLKGTNSCGVTVKSSIPVTFYSAPATPSISNFTVGYNATTLIHVPNAASDGTYNWYNASQSLISTGVSMPVTLKQIPIIIFRGLLTVKAQKSPSR